MSYKKLSYFHRADSAPLLGRTIPEHFLSIVEQHANNEAVVSLPQKRRLTYQDFSSSIDQLARGLIGLGFKRGDAIGIWSTNNVEWLLVQMATARIGVIQVNINPAYRPKELAFALDLSEVKGLFVIPSFNDNHYADVLQDLIPELRKDNEEISNEKLPNLRRVILYDPEDSLNTQKPAPGFTCWQQVIQAADGVTQETLEAHTQSLDRDDVINIQYTSGTTGFPKAVMLTHHNILNNAWFGAQAMHFTESDRLVVPIPFYHCFGMVLANLLSFSVGACVVISSEHFEPEKVLQAV